MYWTDFSIHTWDGFAGFDGLSWCTCEPCNLGTWEVLDVRLESDRWVNVFSSLNAFN